VIVGYRTEVKEQRYVLDNTVVPGSRQETRVPIYESLRIRFAAAGRGHADRDECDGPTR